MNDFLYHAQNKEGIKLSAWVKKGKLKDLYLCDSKNGVFVPESIFWGKVQKALPGTGGYFISLPENRIGFLRNSPPLMEGDIIIVQISSYPQFGKQIPLQSKIVIKGKGVILTPGVPGINISKAIVDQEKRNELYSLVETVVPRESLEKDNFGLILRTSCLHNDHQIKTELKEFMTYYRRIFLSGKPNKPTLVASGPSIHARAERDWQPEENFIVQDVGDAIDTFGLWDLIIENTGDVVELGNKANLVIEKTQAMIVIDVNSGGMNSKTSARNISMQAAGVIPNELRIRGLGGKVIIDFPSMNQSDRKDVEKCLAQAFNNDYVPTKLAGWTKLGSFELQRKRDRIPVNELVEI